MAFELPKNSTLIILLISIYLVTRLPLLNFLPFVQDEGIYAIMINEQVVHHTIIPTFLDYPVGWKPILFFWVYSLFSQLPSILPLEVAYRLPSFIFGLLSVVPLFLLLKGVSNRTYAFFSTVIFLVSLPSVYSNDALLTDSLFFFLTICSIYLYTEHPPKRIENWRFAAGGFLAVAAFFTKHILAFMIPLLIIIYFFNKKKEIFKQPIFLLSLTLVPLCFLLNLYLIAGAGLSESYFTEFTLHLITTKASNQFEMFIGSVSSFLQTNAIWFSLSLFGFWKYRKENLFMSVWYILTIFPLLSGYFMIWYYLPVMPAIAYFAALFLIKPDGKERIDFFFSIFLAITLILSLVAILYFYSGVYTNFIEQKSAGLILVGKQNTLIIGNYQPGLIAYKMLNEKLQYGHASDFGWILNHNGTSAQMEKDFIENYHNKKYQTLDSSFKNLFNDLESTFRKDSNLTAPDYVAILGDEPEKPYNNSETVYHVKTVAIYKITK